MGRSVARSWSGVRGMLFLLGRGERERWVLRMRAVVLCSLAGGWLLVEIAVKAREEGRDGRRERGGWMRGIGARRKRVEGEAHYNILCFHPELERIVFLLQLGIGGCQVLDPFLVVALCFCKVGGFGLKVFDAGGQTVHDMGFLVGACHCEVAIDGIGWDN